MTHDELLELVGDVQRHQTELDDVEVKSARGGTPRRLFESLSSFANRSGGGVLLFGLDETQDFEVVGVGNVHRLQEELGHLASADMEPALRPEFRVQEIKNHTVLAVEVPEVTSEQKPCYYKPAGLPGGAYIRVGNTNRQMTDYEVFGYLSTRRQPRFDEEIVSEATLDDLDRVRLEAYVEQLRRERPTAGYVRASLEQVLKTLRVIGEVGGVLRPTLAGLLVFGDYPQAFEPQLVITFLHYFGTTETEAGPRGERFLDNRKFEGAMPEVIEGAVDYVLASMRKSSLIEGLYRRDIPEYPREAIREAVVNAVAHRDYSHYVRGSQVQIKMFADRLEVQSPGGLYGNVTEDTLEETESTRNRHLMRLLEDLHIAENRGSGIDAMLAEMRQANMQPPRFLDKRMFFRVTLRNHTLMGSEAVSWLNQFSDYPLNDHQRLALVYLRANERLTNSDYRRLNHMNSVAATRDLRGLVGTNLVEQHGTRGGAFYTLKTAARAEPVTERTESERVLAYVQEHGSINNAQCRELLNVNIQHASYLLKRMLSLGHLEKEGSYRWTSYRLP